MTQFPHLRIVGGMYGDAYSPPKHRRRGRNLTPPPRQRSSHAASLRAQFKQTIQRGNDELRQLNEEDETEGLTLTLESSKDFELKLDSLRNRTKKIQLLHVTEHDGVQSAVIFVPRNSLSHFLTKLDEYESSVKENAEKPRNWRLIDSIERVRLAIAEDLWESTEPFPTGTSPLWWEAWFRRDGGDTADEKARITKLCEELDLETRPGWLMFSEVYVTLIKARPQDWGRSRALLERVAELRRPPEPSTPYLSLSPSEQGEWIADFRKRLRIAHPSAPHICLLDTGVHRGHPLLQDSLLESDCLAVNPEWGSADNNDDDQHGTLMAGTALFGNLTEHFSTTQPTQLEHRLESVRIFPRSGSNPPDSYGWITQQAISIAEITNPMRRRICCLATTAPNTTSRWIPTSWSASVDQSSYNNGNDTRLFIVSTGNVRHWPSDIYEYPEYHWTENAAIEDPAHATNALVVGAYTECCPTDRDDLVGANGGIAPTSRTSVAWDDQGRSSWPLKPDVVFEGGNLCISNGLIGRHADSEILTTSLYQNGGLLDTYGATSAATAQGSRLAAQILASYPHLRAETIRGLIVHSANWTPTMKTQIPAQTKADYLRRIRAFGYGVPNRQRALSSLSNEVTMVSEEAITPYEKRDGSVKLKQMGIHSLPWPKSALRDLGSTPITMRITLSYFIEPNPGRRGRIPLTTYPSHDLRFDLQRDGESLLEFKQRISDLDSDEETESEDANPNRTHAIQPWAIGPKGRTKGSVHSDWWTGTAENLANCESLIVFPVGGWWKDRSYLNKYDNVARYSLIVSIETPSQSIDLYTMLTTQTSVPVEVATS